MLIAFTFCLINKFDSLAETLANLIDTNLETIKDAPAFLNLHYSTVKAIATFDEIAEEIYVFEAVTNWINTNKAKYDNKQISELVESISLSTISTPNLLSCVRRSGLISDSKICDVLESRYRNICSEENGAEIVSGNVFSDSKCNGNCLRNPPYIFTGQAGFTRQELNQRIVIKMKNSVLANRIKMHLYDRDNRNYSYVIETSDDGEKWDKIVDYSEMDCQSMQEINFVKRKFKFLSVMGTRSKYERFHIVSLSVEFNDSPN